MRISYSRSATKKKLWKSPEMKQWFMFVVDGKIIDCLEDSTAVQKEKKRLKDLKGIDVVPATNEVLIHFRAETKIPKRILSKMSEAARHAQCDKLIDQLQR